MNRAGGVMAALTANAVAIAVLLPVVGVVWPGDRQASQTAGAAK